MLVYGDPVYGESLPLLSERLRASLRRCLGSQPSSDRLRAVLIEAGQLEQAVADFFKTEEPQLRKNVERITRLLGRALVAAWQLKHRDAQAQIHAAADEAERLQPVGAGPLRVKVPEGFAFYALFPEQFCQAAWKWADSDHGRSCRVIVLGLRSIGTALGAAVAAALEQRNYSVEVVTARPNGHPFSRSLDVDASSVQGFDKALVVDEGPGLSGSSMSAAADGLERAGVSRDQIVFLASHMGYPGGMATENARHRWETTPRFAGSIDELSWNDRSLTEVLAERTESLTGWGVTDIQDLSAGMWRTHCYENPDLWPPVWAPFERTKYRCTLANGHAVLWRFHGWAGVPEFGRAGSDLAQARMERRAALGWTPRVYGQCLGFVAQDWCDDPPLRNDAGDPRRPDMLAQMGMYIQESAGPVMRPHELSSAYERLADVIQANTREALGDEFAERAIRLARCIREEALSPRPAAGDGRMAPWEWRRSYTGSLIKLDAAGHDCDHTIIGRQPILWDLAGTIVEWDLAPEETFLAQTTALLDSVSPDVVAFYVAAYAAFRMGISHFCAELASGPADRERLERAIASYQLRLQRTLGDGILARH